MGHPRITIDPNVQFGKPVIKGTRVPVELISKLLGKGQSIEALLKAYPHLVRDDILAAQAYAAEHLPRASAEAAE
jgi:uncharacterized protein (DUF433 family)